jgi:hypothetical protein
VGHFKPGEWGGLLARYREEEEAKEHEAIRAIMDQDKRLTHEEAQRIYQQRSPARRLRDEGDSRRGDHGRY